MQVNLGASAVPRADAVKFEIMPLSPMKKYLLIFSLIMGVISCNQFDEYPPDKFLSKNDQSFLLNSFIKDYYDSLESYDVTKDKVRLNDLKELVFKLEYYTERKGLGYFMVSEDRAPFGGPSFFYGGKLIAQEGDSALNLLFRDQTNHVSEDSIKRKFNKLIE